MVINSQSNHLLFNEGDGSYSGAIDLPGGTKWIWSIAVADVNGDGMVEILIAICDIQKNQFLLNEGVGNYS